jgi:hypothetical protein
MGESTSAITNNGDWTPGHFAYQEFALDDDRISDAAGTDTKKQKKPLPKQVFLLIGHSGMNALPSQPESECP